MTTRIQLRRGIAAQWTSADPVLALGEAGVETDTLLWKVGDGTTVWSELPYMESANENFGNVTVSGNISAGNILTNNYLYANGAPVSFSANTGNITFNASTISTNAANTGIEIQGNGTGAVNITTGANGFTQLQNDSYANGSSYVYLEDGNVYVESATGNWTFDNTGNLTLPDVANASINYANGQPYGGSGSAAGNAGDIQINVAGGLGADSTLRYVDNGGEMTLYADYLNAPGIFTSDIYAGDGSPSNLTLTTSYGNAAWTFGADGTTVFPSYTFPNVDGTAGQVFATNGSGTIYWANAGSGGSVYANTVGSFGSDMGIGPNYAGNDPAILFGEDDVLIRTGGTASAGGQNYGELYLAGSEDAYFGQADNLVDSTYPTFNTSVFANSTAITLAVPGPHTMIMASDGTFTYDGSNIIGGGTANTGNITFNDINIIGTGNLHLQPDSTNASAYLDIYLTYGPDIHIAGNGENVIVGRDDGANVTVNTNGNVTIQSWNGTANTWTFGNDGTFVTPGVSGNITGANNISAVTYTAPGNVQLVAGGETLVFDTTGAVTLPSSMGPGSGAGVIQTANAYPTLLAYGSSGHGGPEMDWMNANDPANTFNSSSTLRHTMFLNGDGFYIGLNENNVGNVFSGHWQFDTDGNLTLPGAIGFSNSSAVIQSIGPVLQIAGNIQTNQNTLGLPVDGGDTFLSANANVNLQSGIGGTNYEWSFGVDGNLILPRGGVIYETNIPSGFTANTIALAPSGGSNIDQQLLVYPTVSADANHLHLTSGNVYNTELFLGNDDLYVKLANTGNVVINSFDPNVVAPGHTWTFANNGNLNLPQGGYIGPVDVKGFGTMLTLLVYIPVALLSMPTGP